MCDTFLILVQAHYEELEDFIVQMVSEQLTLEEVEIRTVKEEEPELQLHPFISRILL